MKDGGQAGITQEFAKILVCAGYLFGVSHPEPIHMSERVAILVKWPLAAVESGTSETPPFWGQNGLGDERRLYTGQS
jgi:hypothetical protein